MDEKIPAKQRLRFQILEIMYGAVDGNANAFVAEKALSEHLGIERRLLSYEIDFLVRERLLGRHGQDVTLTHEGMREVEAMRTRPDEPTRHFVAFNVMNIGSMVGSQINQASPSAAQTTAETLSPTAHGEAILAAVERMETLDPQQRSELLDVAQRLLVLLRAPSGHASPESLSRM
jgi:hypothetical protein